MSITFRPNVYNLFVPQGRSWLLSHIVDVKNSLLLYRTRLVQVLFNSFSCWRHPSWSWNGSEFLLNLEAKPVFGVGKRLLFCQWTFFWSCYKFVEYERIRSVSFCIRKSLGVQYRIYLYKYKFIVFFFFFTIQVHSFNKNFLLNKLQPRLVFFPLMSFFHFDAEPLSSIHCKSLLVYPVKCQHFRMLEKIVERFKLPWKDCVFLLQQLFSYSFSFYSALSAPLVSAASSPESQCSFHLNLQ